MTARGSGHILSGDICVAFVLPFGTSIAFGRAIPMARNANAIKIRKARPEDLDQIKKLAARNSDALGFVLRPALEQAILEGRLVVAEMGNRILGFQEYYHRKRDRQTTLYHKCVAAEFRGHGIGKALVDAVVAEAQNMGRTHLLLKCPEDLPANEFHRRYGFKLVAKENGRRRRLNVWRLNLL
ncbi:MAG TPA: N-acetyltransferase [Methylomirabilota bacterium]|nr:N-acetyltransferase [Methylomirabilota bacterium]